KLRPEMELRPVPLPSKDDWEAAQKVAAALCGVSGSKLLDAENVATLASGVRRVVDPERKASVKLPDEIRHRLGWLGMGDAEIESAARLQTAVAVAKLAAKLEQCEEDASLVHTLAKAEIATSGSAMGRSLRTATAVLESLQNADWTVFESVRGIDGGEAILGTLREVLTDDELAQDAGAKIRALRDRAMKIIVEQARPGPVRPTPVPVSETGGVSETGAAAEPGGVSETGAASGTEAKTETKAVSVSSPAPF